MTWSIVVGRVGPAPVFDAMDFQDGFTTIERACKAVLAYTKFGERTTSERFQEFVGVSPLGIDNLVQLGNDSVLDVGVE